ncbi:carbohydrate ABC transporter permease [Cohnella thailandensis]|uniref:Carbohydrate ABC transporter permease n=1 Tax=Cohnella thailandensis TaxID=557557 RepID=A0A841T3M9_9BACL|nr:carbohydrate ABC transporter permease [Cohnella thailandensis]MBB6635721.1 carbohydrate ABC transporter permease [Cohnella thailandensis]MBP1976097.1 putative aldouronate transport system permease protein [Cohnella thailandensis]
MAIRENKTLLIIFYVFIGLFALVCLVPFVLAVSGSLSTETEIAANGYSFLPQGFTFDTYKFMFGSKSEEIVRGYLNSVMITAMGTASAVIVTSAYAYVITAKGFRHRNVFAFFAYFTMLFSGGTLPWYILATKYYHLDNTLAGLFVPYLLNVFLMYLQANYFKSIPHEVVESAQIDGAGHYLIFFRIMLPLGQVGLVTISLFYALQFWNDFFLPLMLVTDEKLFTIQYMMYYMMANIQFLASGAASRISGAIIAPPLETAKLAMTCLTVLPIAILYPFLQRYFVRGIIVGSVKG